MRKFTLFLMSLFLSVGAMAQENGVIKGLSKTPTEKVDLSQGLQTGYYLLKQVNDNAGSAGGQGVGYIKAASEAIGASATSKNTGNPSENDATYIWYVDVMDANNNLITISTANKVAAWQAPSRNQKNLVAYASRATLKYHTGTVNLSGNATPKEGSCFISTENTSSFVHFSGDNLGSWDDTNQNSMFMVEFYEVSVDDLVYAPEYTITYNYKQNGVVVASVPHKVVEGGAYPALASGLYGVTVNGTKPSGTVTKDETYEFEVTVGEMPFEYYESYEAVEEANGWYNLIMHSNWNTGNGTSRYRTYVGAGNETNLAWGTERSLTNPSNDYYWAFVGNPITGFSIVNKDKGATHILSSNGSTNPVMLEAEGLANGYNTTWQVGERRYNVSQEGDYILEGAWFCLKYPNSNNYINANAGNGNVAFWSDNDNGSAILAVKPLTINEAADVATFYSDNYVMIPSTMGAEVYYANGINEAGYMGLEQITGEVIPAQTGVVVKYNTESNVVYAPEITSKGTTAAVSGNLLKGTTKRTLINKDANKAYYVLGMTDGVGFYNAVNGKNENEFYNGAFKAYLEMPAQAGTAAFYGFDWAGTTTIENVEVENEVKAIFDLTGRRVEAITAPGIYIVGGKKVLVK